jgi:hypothetical protein
MKQKWKYWDYLKFFKLLNNNNHEGVSSTFLAVCLKKDKEEVERKIKEVNRVLGTNNSIQCENDAGALKYFIEHVITKNQIKEVYRMSRATAEESLEIKIRKVISVLRENKKPMNISEMMDLAGFSRDQLCREAMKEMVSEKSGLDNYLRVTSTKGRVSLIKFEDPKNDFDEALEMFFEDRRKAKKGKEHYAPTEKALPNEVLAKPAPKFYKDFKVAQVEIFVKVSVDPEALKVASDLLGNNPKEILNLLGNQKLA